jgi:hypothetical protein
LLHFLSGRHIDKDKPALGRRLVCNLKGVALIKAIFCTFEGEPSRLLVMLEGEEKIRRRLKIAAASEITPPFW